MIVDLPHTVTSSLYSTFFLPLSHPLFFIKSATPQQATGNHQVEVIGLAPQRPSNDLLAQKLGAEGANSQDVGDIGRVPAFGEHGDRHNAPNARSQLAILADSVHNLTEQFLIGDVFGSACIVSAFNDLAAEAFDLVGRHGSKTLIEGIAGLELLGVDKDGIGARERVPGAIVKVAEKSQAAILQS